MENIVQNQSELGYELSTRLVNQVVERNYLTDLNQMPVASLDFDKYAGVLDGIRMFKVSEIVFETKENITQKLANVYNSLSNRDNSIFLLIDANTRGVDLYLGVRQLDPTLSIVTSSELLKKSLIGQFPGIKLDSQKRSEITTMQEKLDKSTCIATVSGIPMVQAKDSEKNENFIQGLEKVINSLQGESYQCVVLASSVSKSEINDLRLQYENIYSELTPMRKTSVTYGKNNSYSLGKGKNTSQTNSATTSTSISYSVSESNGITKSQSKTRPSKQSKIAQGTASVLSAVGTALSAVSTAALYSGVGTPAGAVGLAVGGGLVAVGGGVAKALDNKETISDSNGTSNSHSVSNSQSNSTSHSDSYTSGESTTETNQIGNTQSVQSEYENKTISNMLEHLDFQFKRLDQFDDTSAWESAVYFLSKEADVTEMAASTYQSIMSGEHSGVQVTATNSWLGNGRVSTGRQGQIENMKQYLCHFLHPEFIYNEFTNAPMALKASSIISSQELAIELGLPRHSVLGVPVIKHAKFAQNGFKQGTAGRDIKMGNIFQAGTKNSDLPPVNLQLESLTGHTFITGSTGSGKSNTVYRLLSEALDENIHFMVIEPAKGEYKNVFGNRKDVHVFGTNPMYTPLLKVNPFAFPKGVHVYEHIDRLIEIFNVSWPMYAAMPAILKKAVIKAYENTGWNLQYSTNASGLYPNFADLIECLKQVINSSDYSEESKGNYIGSLVTRVESLANGLNGMIFSADELGDQKLFDDNTIVDLSRVGSGETKSLIMGILVMRLSEYRMNNADLMNAGLKHLTVLEEAHNILKRSTGGGPEGADMSGKSVEMLTNAIAEMRTYGEGFVIVDQTPAAVDPAAIRNTNTKVIMRLPDFQDRELVGRSAALNDEQLNEIALLPKGVGVVYQNDWLEPVLCHVARPDSEILSVSDRYQYHGHFNDDKKPSLKLKKLVYRLVFISAVSELKEADIKTITPDVIVRLPLSSMDKMALLKQKQNYLYHEFTTESSKVFYHVMGIEKGTLNDARNRQLLEQVTGSKKAMQEVINVLEVK